MTPLLQKLIFSLLPRRAPPLMRPVMKVISRQLLATLVDPRLKQHRIIGSRSSRSTSTLPATSSPPPTCR